MKTWKVNMYHVAIETILVEEYFFMWESIQGILLC
jgi:hypothetical protein